MEINYENINKLYNENKKRKDELLDYYEDDIKKIKELILEKAELGCSFIEYRTAFFDKDKRSVEFLSDIFKNKGFFCKVKKIKIDSSVVGKKESAYILYIRWDKKTEK